MSRIFMDVGAHMGETAEVVLQARYAFDRVCCFEPSSRCIQKLSDLAISNNKLEVYPFGLSSQNRDAQLYNSGSLSASTLASTNYMSNFGIEYETVRLEDIIKWLCDETGPDDFIVLKLNCEGGEIEILDRLLETDFVSRFYTILITFDIREFPGGLSEELRIRRLLRVSGQNNYCFSDDVMIGPCHKDRLSNWLSIFGVDQVEKSKARLQAEFRGVFRLYARKSGRFARFEVMLKRLIRFNNFPLSVKRFFRGVKSLLRLNRERQPPSSQYINRRQ